MIGYQADQLAMGLGHNLTFVGGGGTVQPEQAMGGGVSLGGSGVVAWGILFAILIGGYLFFSPITL